MTQSVAETDTFSGLNEAKSSEIGGNDAAVATDELH